MDGEPLQMMKSSITILALPLSILERTSVFRIDDILAYENTAMKYSKLLVKYGTNNSKPASLSLHGQNQRIYCL
jgi:hypothetical protein